MLDGARRPGRRGRTAPLRRDDHGRRSHHVLRGLQLPPAGPAYPVARLRSRHTADHRRRFPGTRQGRILPARRHRTRVHGLLGHHRKPGDERPLRLHGRRHAPGAADRGTLVRRTARAARR
ncbi:hypothetical protein OG785_04055 [Streptomyces sp. NBC_00006]|nr:hypothetical protein [Streptomyces sp. NBC_00006]